MSDVQSLTAEPLFTLDPAIRYADALQRYNKQVLGLIDDITIACELNSTQRNAFVKVFGDYRKAILADDTQKQVAGEEAIFKLADSHGIPTGMNYPFYSAVLDFSFHVQLLADVEKECVEKFSLAQ